MKHTHTHTHTQPQTNPRHSPQKLTSIPTPTLPSWMSSCSIVNHGFSLLLALEAPALPPGQPAMALAFAGVDPSPQSMREHVASLCGIVAGACVVVIGVVGGCGQGRWVVVMMRGRAWGGERINEMKSTPLRPPP